jgi:hypothetical protein
MVKVGKSFAKFFKKIKWQEGKTAKWKSGNLEIWSLNKRNTEEKSKILKSARSGFAFFRKFSDSLRFAKPPAKTYYAWSLP